MTAPRPETIIMREARQAAREDGLRVTIKIGGAEITIEPVASTPAPATASAAWDRAAGIRR